MRRLLLLLLSAFALLALGFAVATGRLTLPRNTILSPRCMSPIR
jgi:hypothetical protein